MHEGLKCPNCGGALPHPVQGQQILVCPFCGMQHAAAALLHQSDAVQIEQIRANAAQSMQQQVMQHQMQMQYQTIQQQMQMQKQAGEQAELNQFKKGKLSKFLIIFAAVFMILTVVWLKDGLSVRGILAGIQTGLFVVAWLMGLRLIKAKPIARVLVTLAAFLLIVPVIAVSCNDSDEVDYDYTVKAETLNWENIKLGDRIPAPDAKKAKIHSNTDERLYIEIPGQTATYFDAYADRCADVGFVVDQEETDNSFDAYNSEGYKLRLFLDSEGELTIELEDPIEMKEFTWPVSKSAEILPALPSNMGHVEYDWSNAFCMYVGDVTPEEYAQYVKECQDCGFDVDYSKGDDYYYAENAYGDDLDLTYMGFNTMYLHLSVKERKDDMPKSTEPAETQAPETTAAPTEAPTEAATKATEKKDDGLIGADFKQAMDDYEAFMDEYVEFMKKYSQSGGTDISMLGEYAEFMDKYTKCMESFEKWEDEELNAAELAYYLEVQTRVQKKLMSVY